MSGEEEEEEAEAESKSESKNELAEGFQKCRAKDVS